MDTAPVPMQTSFVNFLIDLQKTQKGTGHLFVGMTCAIRANTF